MMGGQMIASRRQGESSPLAPRKEKGAEAMLSRVAMSISMHAHVSVPAAGKLSLRGARSLSPGLYSSSMPPNTYTRSGHARSAWKFRSECPTADGPEKPRYTSSGSPWQGSCLQQDLVVCSGNAARQRDMPVRDETSFSAPGSCSWSGLLGSMRSVCPRCVRE